MANKMTPELYPGVFPAPKRLGFRGQASIQTEIMKKPVGLKLVKISSISLYHFKERTFEDFNLMKRKRMDSQGDSRLNFFPHQQFFLLAAGKEDEADEKKEKGITKKPNFILVFQGATSFKIPLCLIFNIFSAKSKLVEMEFNAKKVLSSDREQIKREKIGKFINYSNISSGNSRYFRG